MNCESRKPSPLPFLHSRSGDWFSIYGRATCYGRNPAKVKRIPVCCCNGSVSGAYPWERGHPWPHSVRARSPRSPRTHPRLTEGSVEAVTSCNAQCPSFISQRNNGVHFCPTPRGNEGGDERAEGESNRPQAQGQWVPPFNPIKQTCQHTPADKGSGNADRQTQANQPKRPAQHQRENAFAVSPEGHADADLVRSAV